MTDKPPSSKLAAVAVVFAGVSLAISLTIAVLALDPCTPPDAPEAPEQTK